MVYNRLQFSNIHTLATLNNSNNLVIFDSLDNFDTIDTFNNFDNALGSQNTLGSQKVLGSQNILGSQKQGCQYCQCWQCWQCCQCWQCWQCWRCWQCWNVEMLTMFMVLGNLDSARPFPFAAQPLCIFPTDNNSSQRPFQLIITISHKNLSNWWTIFYIDLSSLW